MHAPGGLIPACAGKTSGILTFKPYSGAHPRMRGENAWSARVDTLGAGSSPHARGKPQIGADIIGATGLIPACAGKTVIWDAVHRGAKAHPRMRGENKSCSSSCSICDGSSPHARGKPGAGVRDGFLGGLIPACAGKTLADLDQHRAIEPIRYNLSRIITDIKPRQRREKLEPLSSKGSPPPLRGCPLI